MKFKYLLFVPLLAVSLKAASVNDLTFTLDGSGTQYSVTACNTLAEGGLDIPSFYNSLPVTSIGRRAFLYCSNLTSITIPDSVTLIDSYAFTLCQSLSSIIIPDGVTIINRETFAGCTSLTSVSLPTTLNAIRYGAFLDCPNLPTIEIPDSVTEYETAATNATIEYIDEIGYIFSANRVNAYVVDFSNVTSSGVVIPAIIEGATVRSVTGNQDNSSIYDFESNNTVITSITLPETVGYIGTYGFLHWTALTTINFPENLTSLVWFTFAGCSSLTSVNIPENLTDIDTTALYKCSSLSEITVSADNPVYTSLDNSIYNKTLTTLVRSRSNVTDISLPNSVTTIGGNAYSGCLELTNITIPETITTVGLYSFGFCSNLTNVNYGRLSSIDPGVFTHCTSLKSVNIPNSVTSIASETFDYCTSLSSITIPDSVTSIAGNAFRGCSKLSYIRSEATSAPTILPDWWNGTNESPFNGVAAQSIFVPTGAVQSYLDAGNGSTYGGLMVAEPSNLQSLANMIEITIETDISTGEVSPPFVATYNESGDYTILDISTGESFVAGSWAWDPIAQVAYFGGNLMMDLWDYQFEGFMNSYIYPYTASIYRDSDNPTVATATAIGVYYDGFTDLDNNGKMDIYQINDGDPFPDSSFIIGLTDLLTLNSSYIPESVLSHWTNLARGKVIEYKSYKSTNLDDWELFDTKLVPYNTEQDQLFIKSEINILD